jgi:hypothetical protein
MPAAAGIPDRTDYGDLSKLRAGELYDWILHRHDAEKAKLHYDLRIGSPGLGLYSWAARKGMPQPGQKHLAVQQPIHSHEYGSFEGTIPEGYGKGTVEKVEPGKVHFTLASKRYPERFVLVRPTSTTGVGAKPNNWLLMNTTPTKPLEFNKEHYKSIPADQVEPLLKNLTPTSSVQAKIDGALTLTHLLKDKIEVLSYRKSKVHGGPLLHTERTFHTIPETTIPKQYVGSVLQGELYGQQHGTGAIPPQMLSGILNSSLAKSYEAKKANDIKLKQMIFDVQQIGNKKVDRQQIPYEQRSKTIRDILSAIGGPNRQQVQDTIHAPEEAKTPRDALQLYQDIAANKHPQTNEGIVIHPPTGTPMKSKLFDEHDVHVRGFFPGKGKWQDRGIGGFVYSHEPTSPIAGEVGTGFSDAMRQEMFNDPDAYIGRKARVQSTGKLPSGALFQPSLLALHE